MYNDYRLLSLTSLLITEVKFSVPSTSILSCQYLPTNASFSHFIGLLPTPCCIGNWQWGNILSYAFLQRNSTLHMPKIIEGQADTRSCSYNKTYEMHKFLKFIFGIELYMFRTGFLSIIRSLVPCTQQLA